MVTPNRVYLIHKVQKETTMTLTLAQLQPLIEEAVAVFTGDTDQVTAETVECVATRVHTALEMAAHEGCWSDEHQQMFESSSTYVQTDLDEEGLEEWVACLEESLAVDETAAACLMALGYDACPY